MFGRRLRLQLDNTLFLCPLALSLIGIAFIYSATSASAIPREHFYYEKQTLWLLLGLIVAAVAYFIPLKVHEALAYVYYGTAIFLLVAVILLTQQGAARWLSLGGLNFQPAELAKFAICAVLARYLVYRQLKLRKFLTIVFAFALVAVPTVLIIKQPDVGSSLVGLAIFLFLLMWSGMPLTHVLLIVSPLISLIAAFHWLIWAIVFVGFLVLLYLARPGVFPGLVLFVVFLAVGMATPSIWNRLHDYQRKRIITFLDPGRDPAGAGYQIIQSKIAVGSGGLLGRGFMKGTQTKLEFLPARHTDFIFSVICEELGFAGGLLVVLLLTITVFRGFTIAAKARNPFHSHLAFGLTGALAFQAAVNLGMTVGIMPVTGIPLPFVSYGGSSMLFNWGIIGILQAVKRDWQEY